MTTTCPNGHDSEWPDWCSVCGERLGADPNSGPPDPSVASTPAAVPEPAESVAPAVSSPTGPACDNCGVPRREDDVFCESCGYDFASGSLPESPDAAAAPTSEASQPPMHAKVSVDVDFFSASVGDADLTLPNPLPDVQIVPLAGIRILIGRSSTSRGIFPEIDVQALTRDPAVSSRHAMLERDPANGWTLTDLGSTNGTFLTPVADTAIEAGAAISVVAGTTMYLGAWTRIELAQSM